MGGCGADRQNKGVKRGGRGACCILFPHHASSFPFYSGMHTPQGKEASVNLVWENTSWRQAGTCLPGVFPSLGGGGEEQGQAGQHLSSSCGEAWAVATFLFCCLHMPCACFSVLKTFFFPQTLEGLPLPPAGKQTKYTCMCWRGEERRRREDSYSQWLVKILNFHLHPLLYMPVLFRDWLGGGTWVITAPAPLQQRLLQSDV